MEVANKKETTQIMSNTIFLCSVLAIPSGLMLDNGAISGPLLIFFFSTAIYLGIKIAIWHKKGSYPFFNILKRLGLLLFPFYGAYIFVVICNFIRDLKT